MLATCLRHRRKATVARAFWAMERGRWGQVLWGFVDHDEMFGCYLIVRRSLWETLSKRVKRDSLIPPKKIFVSISL